MHEGIEGLRRDKTRPSRIPPLGPQVAERVIALTQEDPPGETTHWTLSEHDRGRGPGRQDRSCHPRQLRTA